MSDRETTVIVETHSQTGRSGEASDDRKGEDQVKDVRKATGYIRDRLVSKGGGYVRISKDRKGESVGVKRQRRAIMDLGERCGITIVSMHEDNDVSASTGRKRPGYDALLAEIESGAIDTVIAWHEDRLHRQPKELEHFMDLCIAHDVSVVFVQAGELDLRTASGRMTARIRGAVARMESEHKSERTKAAYQDLIQRGKPTGGPRPFGLEADKVTHKIDEAQIIRHSVDMILSGESTESVRRWIIDQGVPTVRGGRWRHATVKQILRTPRIAGMVRMEGTLYPAPWEPIIDVSTWRQLQSILDERSLGYVPGLPAGQQRRHRYLGTGLYRCHCGETVVSGGGPSKRGVYQCRSSQFGKQCQVFRARRLVDEWVMANVEEWLSTSTLQPIPDDDSDHADLERQADRHRAKLIELSEMYEADEITREQMKAITNKVRSKLVAVENRIAAMRGTTPLGTLLSEADPRQAFRDASIDRQRAIVDALCTVTLVPMSEFDQPAGWKISDQRQSTGNGVKIEWKVGNG